MVRSTAIYYFRRLYATLNGYILLLALLVKIRLFVKIQDFLAIYRTYELTTRMEFNINLLAVIQFCLFCNSVVSSVIFSVRF